MIKFGTVGFERATSVAFKNSPSEAWAQGFLKFIIAADMRRKPFVYKMAKKFYRINEELIDFIFSEGWDKPTEERKEEKLIDAANRKEVRKPMQRRSYCYIGKGRRKH